MKRILRSIFSTGLVLMTTSVFAADGVGNLNDASDLGTSDSAQVKSQTDRTDKGTVEMNQGATDNESSNLGNADSPQVKKQMEHTDKGASEPAKKHHKSKLMKEKSDNAGTTKGNKVQPNQPESAAPAGN